jgi:hypothetical protein
MLPDTEHWAKMLMGETGLTSEQDEVTRVILSGNSTVITELVGIESAGRNVT